MSEIIIGRFLLLLLAMLSASSYAVTCTSTQNGSWNQANRWNCGGGNGPPAAGDDVVINGHTITFNASASARTVTINGATGLLRHTAGTSYTLTIANALTVNGATASTGTGTFTINAGSVSNNGVLAADTLEVTGALTTSGVVNVGTVNASGTVTNNSGSFSVSQLTFRGATQGATFYGANTAIGSLTVNAGTTVSSNSYSVFSLSGNLTNNGTFSLPNTKMTATGSAAQSIGGTSSVTLGHLVMDKASGGVSLSSDLLLSTELTLTSGIIATGDYRVGLLANDCGGGITRSAGSWINGNLELTAPSWGGTCVFPIGDDDNYAPITFSYPWHAAPLGGKITGRTIADDHPDTVSGTSGISVGKSVNRYWKLTPGSGATFYSFDAMFQYCSAAGTSDCSVVDVDSNANPANFVVAKRTGSTWSNLTPSASTASSRTVSGVTGFGDFAIGEAGAGLTCVSDNFSGGLNSTLWNVAGSGYTPQVVTSPTVPSSRLRLTDNASNRSTFAQVKRWFPAAGNKIVVEFDYFVYGGSGADGITMVLSDAGVPPSPGGYGGSLGYANRSGIDGFNGGWLGIGIDEYGNYPTTGESRRGYPSGYTPPAGANVAAGFYSNSIAIRGSGVGQTSGYALLANSGVVSPALGTTSSTPQRYRITVDHSNNVNAKVKLERNTGSGYVTVVPSFDVRAANSGQAVVPTNFLLSFTGSTGGSTNYHEISNVQICASAINPVGNSTPAANFECLETGTLPTWSTTERHPLYTKLTDAAFAFDVVALKSDGMIENSYVAAGGDPKSVTVQLFDDSASPSPACSAYSSPVATQTLTYVSGDGGRKTLSGNFNLSSAYRKLRCRVTDTNSAPTVYGCSTDTFSVRPQSINSVTSTANADGAGASTTATPAIKAGAAFTITAGTGKPGYNGAPQIDSSKIEWPGVPSGGRAAPGVGTLGGLFTTAANGTTGNGASGTAFTYSEVGYFRFQAQGVFDNTFTALSGDSANGDCTNDFSNTKVGGKYGCSFGNTAATSHFGRFIPDRFRVVSSVFTQACTGGFSYMDQQFSAGLSATVQAQNSGDTLTQNYSGSFAKGAVSLQLENGDSGVPIAAARLRTVGTPAWSGGQYAYSADRFLRLASGPDGPFDDLDIGLTVSDETALAATSRPYLMVRNMDASSTSCTTDLTGLSTAVNVCSATRLVDGARVRFGRLWLGNAYGSERQPLLLPYETQFWNGFAFVRNALDSCTALTTANVGVGNYQNSVNATNLPVGAVGLGAFASGAGTITLAAPSAAGSVDVVARLNPALAMCPAWAPDYPGGTAATADHLRGRWCGASFDRDAVARATFGIARKNRQIYLREGY